MADKGKSQWQGIAHFIFVGSEEEFKTLEQLAERLEAIGIQKGEISKNENMDDVYKTLFRKMFPKQDISEVFPIGNNSKLF